MIGHIFSKGFSVVDVRDPTKPTPIAFLAAPPNTWNIHLQQHDDLLLVIHAKDLFAQAVFAEEREYYKPETGKFRASATATGPSNFSAGLAVYDVSKPEAPRQIGFMPVKGDVPRPLPPPSAAHSTGFAGGTVGRSAPSRKGRGESCDAEGL